MDKMIDEKIAKMQQEISESIREFNDAYGSLIDAFKASGKESTMTTLKSSIDRVLATRFCHYIGHRMTPQNRKDAIKFLRSEADNIREHKFKYEVHRQAVGRSEQSMDTVAVKDPDEGATILVTESGRCQGKTAELAAGYNSKTAELAMGYARDSYSHIQHNFRRIILLLSNYRRSDECREVVNVWLARSFHVNHLHEVDSRYYPLLMEKTVEWIAKIVSLEEFTTMPAITAQEKNDASNSGGYMLTPEQSKKFIDDIHRGKKMRNEKRHVKTRKNPSYDTLRRDGLSHHEIVAMANSDGEIAKPEHVEPIKQSRPSGEIRRLFRLPTPGISAEPGK